MSSQHTGSALTGAAVLFVLLRLLAVSHYDWHTAFALLHTLELDDAPGLFLGTFMADDRISTVLLMVVTPATFFFFLRTRKDPERANTTALLTLIVLVALMVSHTLTYHRWWMPVGAVALGGVFVLAIRNARWLLHWFAWILAGTALAVAAVVSTPWVPKERINDAEDVYVFETSPGYLKVLKAQDREFAILRSEDVVKRVELADH
ncbi:hypothetical protein [Nocardia sp. NRRL S-836]|uniref:hypothetical protein n=1 Tax=Nocardia sp. NRRL S-836 TaxID=1519492 RepID=UPI000AA7842C|nr:hypothetical protein [Nocardia sp. NRRL S-836]